jgi:hypothetical protein
MVESLVGRARLRRPATATLDLRALRALPFATVCVVVSGLGHSFGGGGTVPLYALLIGGLAVWLVAALLAGRERPLGSIAAGLAVGQLGLHLYFHLCCGDMAGMSSGMAGMPGMPGSAGGSGAGSALTALALRLICGPAAGDAGGLPPGTTAGEIVSRAGLDPHLAVAALPQLDFWTHSAFLGLTPLMLLGHLAAAAVCGWWLWRGEAAAVRLAQVTVQLTETLARTHSAPLRTLLALVDALVRGLPGLRGGVPRPGTAWDDAPRLPRTALLRHQVVRRGPPALLPA